MKVSKKIINKILNNNRFSLRAAYILDIRQKSIIELARRKSSKLSIITLVEFYRKEGFTDEEIFEEEKQTIKK